MRSEQSLFGGIMGPQAGFLLATGGEPGKRLLLLEVMTEPEWFLYGVVMGTRAPLLLAAHGGLGSGLLLVAVAGSGVRFLL